MSIYGSESDLSDYIYKNPEIIDEDFQPTTREYETPFGFLDIRGVDREGNIIIIEVKKQAATLNDAHQLKRYVEYFEEIEGVPVTGILVANNFSRRVMRFLSENNLDAVAITWQEIFPSLSHEKPSVTLESFFEENNEKIE